MMANAARRAEGAPGDPAVVVGALLSVAEVVDVDVSRLRMTDYDRMRLAEPALPTLAVVLATFATWKAARAAAARARVTARL